MNSAAAPAQSRRPRLLIFVGLALVIAGLATVAAHALHVMIAGLTQLLFHGRFSHGWTTAQGHPLGPWVILIPALGGGIIALMARYGSRAIIGHGIPEVMQQVLSNRSRIPLRVAWLKPLSAVISIGTGSPYGAEGPVIATGGAIGSLLGQALTMSAGERKTLLSMGAAAGMTAIFGAPVAATLLAVELLLFEFSAQTVVPVALAATFAQALRFVLGEPAALYHLAAAAPVALDLALVAKLALIGLVAGFLAVGTNIAVHRVEAAFTQWPLHWMWRPVLGGLLVGVIGWREPRVFGPGYEIIGALLGGHLALRVAALLCGLKLVAWVLSLGSGTSGGTLAPMLIAGGGLGLLAGAAGNLLLPGAPLDPGLAALAGMVAYFAGGSRAYFASVILGVEITQNAGVLAPLALASAVALGVAQRLTRYSIMSAPVEERGVPVPTAFTADVFAQVRVREVMEHHPATIRADMSLAELAQRMGAHDPAVCHHPALLVTVPDSSALAGLITRRDLLAAIEEGRGGGTVGEAMSHPLICAYPDELLDAVLERLHAYDIGRVPVVSRENPRELLGYLGRGAILSAHQVRQREQTSPERGWIAEFVGRFQ